MSKRFFALASTGLGLLACRHYSKGQQNTYTVSMRGLNVVISGEPDGIAKEIVKDLTSRGAHVYWINHEGKKVAKHISDLAKANRDLNKADPHVEYLKLDPLISKDMESVGMNFKEKNIKIDVIINIPYDFHSIGKNSTLKDPSEVINRNLSCSMRLVRSLYPLLDLSTEGRVINMVPYLLDQPLKDGLPDYEDLFSKEVKEGDFRMVTETTGKAILALTRRQQEEMDNLKQRIKVVAVNPGMNRDRFICRYFPGLISTNLGAMLKILVVPFAKSDKEAAQTALYAAMKPWHEIKGGQYYSECKEANANVGDWEKVWEKTRDFVQNSENKN